MIDHSPDKQQYFFRSVPEVHWSGYFPDLMSYSDTTIWYNPWVVVYLFQSRPDAKLQTYSLCVLNRKMKSWDHGPGPASALTQKDINDSGP